MVAHSALTGADLHEPKGADSAAADTVYVASGTGTGTWKKLTTSNINAGSFDYVTQAVFDGLIKFGSGSPEGIVTANPGTLYLNTDGGAGITLYVKETGTGTTGWVAK